MLVYFAERTYEQIFEALLIEADHRELFEVAGAGRVVDLVDILDSSHDQLLYNSQSGLSGN